MTNRTQVVVIGGGQAGLAAGYHLRRLVLDVVVLDAQTTPGGAWQHAWDSLRLFSPAAYSSLHGRLMPARTGETYPDAQYVVEYLADYEKRSELPVERPVRVLGVHRDGVLLRVETDSGTWHARAVISATGTWWRPFLPAHRVGRRHPRRGRRDHLAHGLPPGPLPPRPAPTPGPTRPHRHRGHPGGGRAAPAPARIRRLDRPRFRHPHRRRPPRPGGGPQDRRLGRVSARFPTRAWPARGGGGGSTSGPAGSRPARGRHLAQGLKSEDHRSPGYPAVAGPENRAGGVAAMDERCPLDRPAVHAELERVRADFHHFLAEASAADLRRPTDGTRWTNEQLLFHLLFGHMLVRVLLRLLGVFARLPRAVGRTFAGLLDAAAGPFHVINYVSSVLGSLYYNHRRMGAKMDRTLAALHRRLDRESVASLGRGMHYPPRWDPFFHDWMTRADLYRYATQHYDFHRAQLTLGPAHD